MDRFGKYTTLVTKLYGKTIQRRIVEKEVTNLEGDSDSREPKGDQMSGEVEEPD